jgi:lipid-A-disaccharide synthase
MSNDKQLKPPLRIGILAGEASGDQLGGALMAEILALNPNVVFEGIGGPLMIVQGLHSMVEMDRLSVMGLIEPLKRLFELLAIRKRVKQHFTANPPDLFVGIDSPDFTLNIELALRQQGITTAHYVSPSVWAWRQGRVKKIRRGVDMMLTLFPFEAKFYHHNDVPVAFVGHPLAARFPMVSEPGEVRPMLAISADAKLLTLMPGSRKGEVELMLPVFLAVAEKLKQEIPELIFGIPAANKLRHIQIQNLIDEAASSMPSLANSLQVTMGQSHELMQAADAVLMTSGTTTLEAMLLKRPMVVAYKMGDWPYRILSRIVKTPFIALPNLLANKKLVPELIQHAVSVEAIVDELRPLLVDADKKSDLIAEFDAIHRQLAGDNVESAAQILLSLIDAKREANGR